ncbi:peptidyl-tRNA hydrolase [Tersicoccus solisilvae]|uniref:Peptidyl-tRNA hydrolase n=1 Tax=Tersicoccus solisilvae TaxID=1882339 RepID=A0ABQ1PN89_9MICC|nr:aminoacyl-tRNA hydrolase [Tersicoccus solisilvae]GGC99998.1 peptidyl-tRNA hydrolase [Tersicoccus solisilvae]
MSADTWLVAGLGNPGPGYARHRHNVGAMVLDELAGRIGASFSADARARAAVATGRVRPGGPRVVLAKPAVFMNTSGGPVAALLQYYSLGADQLIVVHDEMDIPFDDVRLKRGGSEGGHNGLKDITRAIGTRDYVRVRVGVGRPPGRKDPADHVLSDFAKTESAALPLLLDTAADAVDAVVEDGLLAAQQRFHGR